MCMRELIVVFAVISGVLCCTINELLVEYFLHRVYFAMLFYYYNLLFYVVVIPTFYLILHLKLFFCAKPVDELMNIYFLADDVRMVE